MAEVTDCVVEQVLVKRHRGLLDPSADEIGIVEALGNDYLNGLDDPDLFDIALSDLRAIKEMRPDLGDFDLACLVRTADEDEDAEAWMRRVIGAKPLYRRVA